jgi:hypothetical protein
LDSRRHERARPCGSGQTYSAGLLDLVCVPGRGLTVHRLGGLSRVRRMMSGSGASRSRTECSTKLSYYPGAAVVVSPARHRWGSRVSAFPHPSRGTGGGRWPVPPTTERSGPSYAHTRGRPRKYTRHDWISVSPFADAVPRGFQLTSAARYVVQLSCDSDMNCSHEGVPALFVQLMAN